VLDPSVSDAIQINNTQQQAPRDPALVAAVKANQRQLHALLRGDKPALRLA